MACWYSPGIADAIKARWQGYNYNPQDVIDMVVRISRPSAASAGEITAEERSRAQALLAAGCE